MNNIFVGNLSPDATERDVRSIFEQHGTVERFRIMTDRETGRPRGFAFVEMADDTVATQAIAALNGTELNGRAINVNAARPQLYRNSARSAARSRRNSAPPAPETLERETRPGKDDHDQNGSLPLQS